jgi:methionyl-tRNA formyltransferase
LKIVFMGTPEYADEILKRVLKEKQIEVIGVFTQPDRPVGRKQVLTPPPVKVSAEKSGIPVFQPEKLREVADEVRKLNPNFIVVGAYGQILSREILDIAPAINLHTSILPLYRGASPIQQALLNGDSETGVTAMLMNEGLDEGDILGVWRTEIQENWLLEDLYKELTRLAGELTVETLLNFDSIRPHRQNSADATYCKKIKKNDGEVSFNSAKEIYQKWKAFTPWPSIYLNSGLKLLDIELSENGNFKEGEILEINSDGVRVGCENGSLLIKEVQPKSKKRMNVISYINGKRLEKGDTLW